MDKDIEKMINDYKKYKLSDYAFSVILGKPLSSYETNPIHVKAARMLVEQGIEVKAGDAIKYIITKDKDGVKPLQLASFKDINKDKYIKHFKSAIGHILDALDMDYDEIVSGKRQSKLGQFFETSKQSKLEQFLGGNKE